MKIVFKKGINGKWYPAYYDWFIKPYHPGWLPELPQPIIKNGFSINKDHWKKYLNNENSSH